MFVNNQQDGTIKWLTYIYYQFISQASYNKYYPCIHKIVTVHHRKVASWQSLVYSGSIWWKRSGLWMDLKSLDDLISGVSCWKVPEQELLCDKSSHLLMIGSPFLRWVLLSIQVTQKQMLGNVCVNGGGLYKGHF